MSQESVERARQAYTALNNAYKQGDVAPMVDEFAHPDLVITTAGGFPERGEWRGPEGAQEFIEGQMEAFEEMRIELDELIDGGDKVLAHARFGGKARHTGIELDFSVYHVLTIRGGRTARLEMYADRSEALEAAGLQE
jgi:ketosteroid isomerase-like protein